MATAKSTSANITNKELRQEFDQLKDQVGDMLNLLKEKGQQKTSEAKEKVAENIENYQEQGKERLSDAYEMSSEQIDKVGEKIQKNPLASILIAFGAGYVISKAMTKDK